MRKTRGRAVLVGDAGEYYVIAEILQQGAVAGLTARNSPNYDAFATDGVRTVNLRIKTKSRDSRDWQWTMNEKHEVYSTVGRNDFTILVSLRKVPTGPTFYVLPTRVLVRRLRDGHLRNLKRWGGKRPKNPLSRHTAMSEVQSRTFLQSYKDRWDRLGLKFG